MDMYLSESMDTKTFCDEFNLSYRLEVDDDSLNEKEVEAFRELSKVEGRFSPFEQDHQDCPGVYYTKEELRNKVIETREKIKSYVHKINLLKDGPIVGILAEICWGAEIDHFEEKIGASKEVVEAFTNTLLEQEKTGGVDIYLNDAEVDIVKRAFNEVKNNMKEEDFLTCFGSSLEDVKKIFIFREITI